MSLLQNEIYSMDCLEGMKHIEDKSIDMILCDLPYGVTARNEWDVPVDRTRLWEQYRRIIKDDGAVVLFGSGMFTATMMQAGESMWRYNLIWRKTTPTGFLNAKCCPLRVHEDIMVFYKKQPTYNPQKTYGHEKKVSTANHKRNSEKSLCYNEVKDTTYDSTERYPVSVLEFKTDKQRECLHPTQKPIELLRWLIRTYTNPGELVLDNACGSGSTCVAAVLEGRSYIGIDNGFCNKIESEHYMHPWASVAKARIEKIRKENKTC